MSRPTGPQDLIVKVIDTTGQGNYPYQPRGKQSLTPGGIFYTSSSGIWQTVWLETVPANYISGLPIVPDVDHQKVRVTVQSAGTAVAHTPGNGVRIEVLDNAGKTVATRNGTANSSVALPVRNPHLWSPEDPYPVGPHDSYRSYKSYTSYLSAIPRPHPISVSIFSIPSRKLGIAGSQPSPRSFVFDTRLFVQARFRVKSRGPNGGVGLPTR
jgi:hypothetical protein